MKIPTAKIDFRLEDGLNINKNADWRVSVSIFDRGNCGVEKPYDLSGFTGKAQLKNLATDHEAIAELDVAIENNVIILSMDSEATMTIPTHGKRYSEVSTFQYDVVLENGEEKYRVMNGSIDVSPFITGGNA